jgi:hypothetical protein
MENYMTIDQVVAAAENDVKHQIERGTMYTTDEWDDSFDRGETVYSITSLYSQWAEDQVEAEDAIWTMFKEKFSKFLY